MTCDRVASIAAPRATAQPLPEPLPADKRAWRAWADAVARARTPEQRQNHAEMLVQEVLRVVVHLTARVVGLYSPIGAEVPTAALADALRQNGVQLAYPRVRPAGDGMDFAPADHPAQLQPRPRSRLLEPVGPALAPELLDCLVVPAQAVRPDGKRLGHGGGYFDRFLPLLRADATTIAVCPAACVVAWQPVEPHDWSLDFCCTEDGLAALS